MSRYDLFRRRIGPIAFGLGILVLAREACTKQQRTQATIVLELGDAAANVKAIAADLVVGDQEVARYRQEALPGASIGTPKFVVSMPAQDGELRIDVELAAGRTQTIRRIHVEEGATVTVPLAGELQSPSPP